MGLTKDSTVTKKKTAHSRVPSQSQSQSHNPETNLKKRFKLMKVALTKTATANNWEAWPNGDSARAVFTRDDIYLSIDHLASTAELVIGKSSLNRKRLNWTRIQAVFKNPTIETFCAHEDGDEDEDEDIEGTAEKLQETLDGLLSLRPSVKEVEEDIGSWSCFSSSVKARRSLE